ncbi:MAG: PH domain-containing protein [Myxococcales bacterium]|nr:PH domain-containing protein [Myxococcales bacterium]
MSEPKKRRLLDGEELIWEGRPNWRAYAGMTVLGWALLPVLVGGVILIMLAIRKRSIAWMVSTRRIEIERGWLSRRIDIIELWRVKDVEFIQGLWDRMVGVSTLRVISQDAQEPLIAIHGLPGDRGVYDQLSNAVMTARQQRGVMNVAQ